MMTNNNVNNTFGENKFKYLEARAMLLALKNQLFCILHHHHRGRIIMQLSCMKTNAIFRRKPLEFGVLQKFKNTYQNFFCETKVIELPTFDKVNMKVK